MTLKKQAVTTLLILILSTHVSGQHSVPCKIVETLLFDEAIKRYFAITKFNGELIVIVDTLSHLAHCSIPNIDGKQIQIIQSRNQKIEGRRTYIDIENVESIQDQLKVTISQRSSGRLGYVTIKQKREKLVIIDRQLGIF